jgi:hypothetical protein
VARPTVRAGRTAWPNGHLSRRCSGSPSIIRRSSRGNRCRLRGISQVTSC